MSNSTTLTLKSKDDHYFTIEKEVAIKSKTLKNLLDEDCLLSVIPLPNLDSETVALVVDLLNKENDDLKKFVEDQQISKLLDLLNILNYLDIREMIDIFSQKIADLIKDKSVEDVREILHIENDFTPEEEQAIRAEYAWAFE